MDGIVELDSGFEGQLFIIPQHHCKLILFANRPKVIGVVRRRDIVRVGYIAVGRSDLSGDGGEGLGEGKAVPKSLKSR